jgi:hypothetical protein
MPPPRVTVAGESALWVDPAEVPPTPTWPGSARRWPRGGTGDRDEPMAVTAAYSGLRWGELAALTIGQVDPAGRITTVDRKVVEVAGHLYLEAPKNRRTIYPRRTPAGYPLAERLAARLERARAEQAAGANPPPGWSSRLRRESAGGPPTSTATSSSAPISRPDGVTPAAAGGGPGTACGTCSAPPPCSPGSSTPPTCPAWPATPTTASPSTCTSAPPRASWTAPAPPPRNPEPCPELAADVHCHPGRRRGRALRQDRVAQVDRGAQHAARHQIADHPVPDTDHDDHQVRQSAWTPYPAHGTGPRCGRRPRRGLPR